tara:strand:- start:183 stop:1682 length:1500 start_codon:yes stop_codon:yes gene_type:complete
MPSVIRGSGNSSLGGNLDIEGVLTYEDVTSVDSVGIVTANAGIDISNTIVSNNDSTIRYDDTDFVIHVDPNNVRGSSKFKINVDTVTGLVIDDNRRLGIGTDNPSDKLEVRGNTGAGVIVLSSGDTTLTGNDVIGQINFKDYDADAHNGGNQNDLVNIKAIVKHETGGASEIDGSDGEGYDLTFSTSRRSGANNAFTVSEKLRIDSDNTVHIGKRDGNSNSTHFGTSRLSICGPDPIATSVSKAGSYLAIGNNESELNGVYPITFGYTNNTNSHQPAYIAYKTTNSSGAECGDLLFGTRNVTTDTEPTEKVRIRSDTPTLQVGKTGAINDDTINSNSNLIADFGRASSGNDITSISVGTGTYRVFSARVPAVFNNPQQTLTATFQFANTYGVSVIEMDIVGGLAQVSVGRYLMIVDCDTLSGQTAQLTGGTSIQTILASGYGNPVFTSSGASATPTFTVSWTRSGSVNTENWAAYWNFFARVSNNSVATPCVLTNITMS